MTAMDVLLDQKQDEKVLLGLSYYASQMLQLVLMDTQMSMLVARNFDH